MNDKMKTHTAIDSEEKNLFSLSPDKTTYLAIITEILMIFAYFSVTNILTSPQFGYLGFIVFGILTNLLLNVIFPICWIVLYKKEPLSELGITKKHLLVAIIISFGFSIVMAPIVFNRLNQVDSGIAFLIYNGIILWEPFFVYCWLQLRYEKAFGIIPGILFTGLSFMAYHIGTFPPISLLVLLFWGIVFAVIFHFVRNLFVLWPLTWSFSSTLGTLMVGYEFTWDMVMQWSIILVIQIGLIIFAYFYRKKTDRSNE